MKDSLFVLAILVLLLSFSPPSYSKEKVPPLCPVEIIAGKAIGPLHFFTDIVSVKALFPKAEFKEYPADQKTGKVSFLSYKGFHISFCYEKSQDIWIDLESFPSNCLTYEGSKISKPYLVKKMKKIFGGCDKEEVRIGGTFFECKDGLRLGMGSGGDHKTIDQIRIGPPLDTKCLP